MIPAWKLHQDKVRDSYDRCEGGIPDLRPELRERALQKQALRELARITAFLVFADLVMYVVRNFVVDHDIHF